MGGVSNHECRVWFCHGFVLISTNQGRFSFDAGHCMFGSI